MKITGHAKIRNRFDIVCKDIITGEEQKYQAHNIVLNNMFTRLLSFYGFFSYIRFGTGTGTLLPTRTSLFEDAGYKSTTIVSSVRELPTSYQMRSIVLQPEEHVGKVLTEVGVAYGTASTSLVTHAFIEDSEGNPIGITKTDTMIITIYATIFFELGELASMHGGQWRWVQPLGRNELLSYLMGATYPTQQFRVTRARDFMDGRTANASHGSSSGVSLDSWTKDAANKRVTTPVRRLGVNTGNGAVRGFGLGSADDRGTFRGQFPITGVFSQHSIEGEQVGVGDGVTKDFNLAWNGATTGSVTVKVDGVAVSPTISEVVGEIGIKLPNPADLPTDTGWGCTFSPDGTLLAVAHGTSPYLTVYSISDGVLTKLDDPATLPTGNGVGCTFSPDGTLLAVAHGTSPYLTVYSISDGVLTKLDNPAALPTGTGRGCAFSPDGTLLAVAHNDSPYLTLYDGFFAGGAVNHITFAAPPATGAVITADYTVPYIPKDTDHVLDLQCSIQWG